MIKTKVDLKGVYTRQLNDHEPLDHQMGEIKPGRFGDIDAWYAKAFGIYLFFVEIHRLEAFRHFFGDEVSSRILVLLESAFDRVMAAEFEDMLSVCVEQLAPGKYVILVCTDQPDPISLPEKALSIRLALTARLLPEMLKLAGVSLEVRVGYGFMEKRRTVPFEDALYKGLFNAQRTALGEMDGSRLGLLLAFKKLQDPANLRMVYQPIYGLQARDIYGWEALVRGPEGTRLTSPAALFDFAQNVGQTAFLEKLCREKAVQDIGGMGLGQKLFINVHPGTLGHPDFCLKQLTENLEAAGLTPDNVVFEMTERYVIRDFTAFKRQLDLNRDQGFFLAVDDVGIGHSGLWSLAEIRPDFIKIDQRIIRNIDADPIKRALLETYQTFTEKIGCRIVAKGIETEGELTCLNLLDIPYGQGFFLGAPSFPKNDGRHGSPSLEVRGGGGSNERKRSRPIGDLAEPAYFVTPDTQVGKVKKVLLEDDEPIGAVVVVEGRRPIGLVMSHHLDRHLSEEFGRSVYFERTVRLVMDAFPLVIEADTPVEVAARRAMRREKNKLYDYIIVTENSLLIGIVSVQEILDTLAKVQIEMAKGANPLTGLPGNLNIEQEIERRPAPYSLIYADLDNFKIYNDIYGFKKGDDVILLLARVLEWAMKRHGAAENFVGHLGGDDFVLVTLPENAERVCRAIVRVFGRLIRYHYSAEDWLKKKVQAKDRNGKIQDFPLVSVSLAIIDILQDYDFVTISKFSADAKKYAKMIEGNSWVRDRRAPASYYERH